MFSSVRRNAGREVVQAMPVLAMILVVVLLGVLLWLLHRQEIEDERQTLIKDILWLEQTLRFQFTSGEEKLQQLVTTLQHGDPEAVSPFPLRAEHLVATHPEIDRVVLRGTQGQDLLSVPPLSGGEPAVAEPEAQPPAFLLARSLGKPAYGPARATGERDAVFEAYVPVFEDGRFAGMVTAIYSITDLLTHDVPWWFTQRYRLTILDGNGQALGANSGVPLPHPGLNYQVPFEPPGHGLTLSATVFRSQASPARNLLAAAIVFLALSAAWSLWALRRHMLRRVAAEEALRTEHAFRKAMEDSLTVGMRARDLSGRITYVNPAFCRMVGFPAEELVGTIPPMPYWIPEDMEKTLELHDAVLAGNAPRQGFELRFCRRNGERFDALIYEAPLIDAKGRHTGWMGSVLDITERKQAEDLARQQQEKLQRTARLTTMGEMASTLAHELNQPLSAIASYNAGCLNRLNSGDFTREELAAALAKLGAQAQRAGQIIRRVHDFVRKSKPVVAPCALGEVIENATGFVAAEARKRGVRMVNELGSALPAVMADRILIEQVLLNLTRNAMEAMARTPVEGRLLTISAAASEGMVTVAVADRGTGIAPEIAERLFSPFFTTKDEGMGMGLNICRSIIEHHQGRLWFEAAPEGGSLFAFNLPVAAP